MKTIEINRFTKNVMMTFAGLIMIFSFSLCSAQADFLKSAVVPAASGSVKVNKDKYNNYIMKIKVINLAEAGKLTPSMNTYVLWMLTDDGQIKNIGQIKTKKSLMAKKLNANLETKSSFKPVKVFITAEYGPELQSPGEKIVLTTDVFNLPKR